MTARSIGIGLGLQVAALLTAYVFSRYLYAIGWLPTFLVSVPLFLASVFYMLTASGPLVLRAGLSFWLLTYPFYWLGVYAWEYSQLREEIVLVLEGFEGGCGWFSEIRVGRRKR